METYDVMVICAHPDDGEFGAAGTTAKWIREGKRVIYVICTSGEKGTSDPNVSPAQLAETREKEMQDAAAVLGVSETIFLRYPDQGLEDTPAFRKHIVQILRQYRPDIVMTSDPYRRYIWHRDHRIIGRVVLDAVFPFARDYHAYPDLIEEGFMPHKVKEIYFWAAEDPNFRSDISETFDIKLEALHCHKSQMDEMKGRDVDGWLKQRCREMATGTDFALAEAFYRAEAP